MYKNVQRKETEEYYSKYYSKMMERWKRSADSRPIIFRKLNVHKLNKKTILDVGCGNGILMKNLELTKKNEVHGIDISKPLLKEAKKYNIKTLFYDVDKRGNLPYPKEYFDVIFLVEIVEHIFYPKGLFKKCYKILKPNGKIYMTIPNGLQPDKKQHIQEMLEKTLEKIYKKRIPEKAKRFPDLNIITIHEIKRILKQTGFKLKELYGWRWKWEQVSSKERKHMWLNPLKARDLLLVIEKAKK